jgi:cold shock CspA family protein
VVKWFDPERGLGAIPPDGGGRDAVAHRSAVHGDTDRLLVACSRVCFDITQDTAKRSHKTGPTGVAAIRTAQAESCTASSAPTMNNIDPARREG